MESARFHLSLGVKSVEASEVFFVRVLGAAVSHRDPSGYINIDFFGSQITLKEHPGIDPHLPDFHFGINFDLARFEQLLSRIQSHGPEYIVGEPEVWDAGTPLERKKVYLRCPSGYLLEFKGIHKRHGD